MKVRICIEGTDNADFTLNIFPHLRVLTLKKYLRMEYGIDVSKRYLEYFGLVLQDYDVIGDRGRAKEKLLIFVRRQIS